MKSLVNTNNISDKQLLSILRLVRSENVSTKLFYELINFFGNAEAALDNIAEFSLKGGRAKPIRICTILEAEKELESLSKAGAGIITYLDNYYPKLLLNIYDPPPLISYLGNIEILSKDIIGIVGARNASANGLAFTKKIAKSLSDSNFCIASGLARGIDTSAHEASFPSTIAVVAGGIGHIYPPENKDLYNRIAKQGVIIAELPFGVAPLAQHFPQRNRIISGISLAVVVMEASLQSGSLITAKFALEQGREVFAIPGFPLDPRSSGTNKLIKEGAILVENTSDIISNLPRSDYYKNKFEDKSKSVFLNQNSFNVDLITDEDRRSVVNLLSATAIDINFILEYTKLPVTVINVILLELELANKIVRSPDNKIILLYQ